MPTGHTPRAHPRWDIGQAMTVEDGSGIYVGCLEDLSLGGAFISGCVGLQVGTGVRLTFRLPTSMLVSVSGNVVRTSDGTGSDRRRGIGIQFQELDHITTQILRDFFKSYGETDTGVIADVRLEEKYHVDVLPSGEVLARLRGYLDRRECEEVARLLGQARHTVRKPLMRVVIDASSYVCGAPDSVAVFRQCLTALGREGTLLGVLVGPKSLGMTQLRRATREAGVADVFTGFGAMPEAREFLGAV